MIIDWKKYVDHIYCIHYAKYQDRKERLEKELKRVGILDSGIFSYQLSYNIPKLPKNASEDNTYNHLQCYCNAKYMGYKKVMILEDDLVFLKDINMIQTLLDNLPKEYDLCSFDYIQLKKLYINNKYIDIFKYGDINEYYKYNYVNFVASNYIICDTLYDVIINRILKDIIINKIIKPTDSYISYFIKDNINDINYDNQYEFIVNAFKYKSIMSNIRMSIQQQYDNSLNIKKYHFNKKLYVNELKDNGNLINIPVNFENYNIYEDE